MRLTRATYRTHLQQRQGGHGDTDRSSLTIDKLPEEVLLDIFDFYRQGLEYQGNYESRWNGRNGWFSLAHVCQNWRRVVLASPSRLRLRLIFTAHTPTGAVVLTGLPPLPIVVDFSAGVRAVRQQNRLVSALRYPDRMWGIGFTGSDAALETVLRAMDNPFPALESLALHCMGRWNFHIPTSFLQDSAQRLLHLNLGGIPLSSLSQLFSSTTGLIDLHLCIDTVFCSSPAASLLAHLQGMPFLRRLELEVGYPSHSERYRPAPSNKTEDVIPLSKLTHFLFFGFRVHLEGLLAGLAAPSLQNLRIVLFDYTLMPPILHLSRFIHDEGRPVFAAKFVFTGRGLDIFLLHSINDPPFRITIPETRVSTALISAALSPTLATVEDLFLTRSFKPRSRAWWLSEGPIPCREALDSGQFRNVEILRLRHALVLDVAEFLRQGDGKLDVLPALKEIELHAGGHRELASKSQRASVLDSFGPFVAVRQRMGRPVNVFWNTYQVVPEYLMYANDRVPSKSPLWFGVGT